MSSHAPPVLRPDERRTVPEESWSRILPARIDVLVARTATRWPAVPLKFARELPPGAVTVTVTCGPPGVIEYVAAPAGTTEAARTAAAATTMDAMRAARGERARSVGACGVIATSNCEDNAEETCTLKIVNERPTANHPSGS